MATDLGSFKVLIVGGGVAGLTLARMLEKVGIDYLLLEGYDKIAPQAGASIGLFPNGLRILDQIGVYDAIRKYIPAKFEFQTRNKHGDIIHHIPNFQKELITRHGYPLMFFDRQSLLQSLYESLEDKSKILPGKRIAHINHKEDGVEIVTKAGEKFFGTIVLGADGVHSTVRDEMLRIGNELEPGVFAPDVKEKMASYYVCCFGISQNVPGWVEGDVSTVVGEGVSQLVISGIDGKVYFFLFSKLDEPKYGDDIPKFTKGNMDQFVQKYTDLPITREVTFGQLYAHRTTATLTPLHEFVLEKWFYGRILSLGDSVHKPNPKGGQGGNGAIESVAEFVNALLRKKDSRKNGLNSLSTEDITDIFEQVQSARMERAKMIVKEAHEKQALSAFENTLKSRIIHTLQPFLPRKILFNIIGKAWIGASRIEQLPLVTRPHSVLYKDETGRQTGLKHQSIGVILPVLALGFAAFIINMIR